MKRSLLLLILLSLFIAIPLTSAQDSGESENPLLTFLTHVPTSAVQQELHTFSYMDYRALEASRNIPKPTPETYLDDLLWIRTSFAIKSGFPLQYLRTIMDSRAETGFNFFDMDRSASFGQPPSQAYLMEGVFDQALMTVGYNGLGYEATEIQGIPALCSVDGCDTGLTVNLENRFPGNPFGGQLGRREPIVFLPDLLANSPNLNTVTGIIQAANDEVNSLADNDYYVALAEAATQNPLIQLNTFNGLELMMTGTMLTNVANLSAEELQAQIDEINPLVGTLPPYVLVGVVSAYTDEYELAQLMIVYNDADQAQTAAETLEARLADYTSIVTGQEFSDFVTSIDGTVDTSVYVSESTGKHVAIWTLRNPFPGNEPDDSGNIPIWGLAHNRLFDMFMMRDVSFLSAFE